ncbi:hypothetical protein DL96DRAFT_1671073 [Flagelloscypha sp. PMI_526]|nr:hypothetical protein DL96DRAFT_1671073 [Flagelloscypha sp. PMI_526]
MFGAEAVSNVLALGQIVFSVPGAIKPDFLIYDCACHAKKQVESPNDRHIWAWWDLVKFIVDVWHFLNKHKTTHDVCQKFCNDSKSWFFNTSVAEQTNIWFNSYGSMTHEMTSVLYNFFLDEMVRLRNEVTMTKLEQEGAKARFL